EADRGNDILVGDYSDITVDGQSDNQGSGTADGADFIRGGSEHDLVVGDSLDTAAGDVTGNGADTLQSGSGNDTEVGDAYAMDGTATGSGTDSLDGAPDNDI